MKIIYKKRTQNQDPDHVVIEQDQADAESIAATEGFIRQFFFLLNNALSTGDSNNTAANFHFWLDFDLSCTYDLSFGTNDSSTRNLFLY